MRDWLQNFLGSVFNLDFHNPFLREGREFLFDFEDDLKAKKQNVDRGISDRRIIEDDIDEIEESDGLLAWVHSRSILGTMAEIYHNSYILNRHTIVVVDKDSGDYEELINHPWLRGLATEMYTMSSEKLYGLKVERLK